MLIEIDYRDKRPLYEQIAKKFEELILKGIMKPDESMPSIRQLAIELSINPNTIQKSYAALETSGFTYSVSGRGSFVANVEDIMPKKKEEFYEELKALIKKASDLGISGKELITLVEKCCAEEEKK